MPSARLESERYQFLSFWFDLTSFQTHGLETRTRNLQNPHLPEWEAGILLILTGLGELVKWLAHAREMGLIPALDTIVLIFIKPMALASVTRILDKLHAA